MLEIPIKCGMLCPAKFMEELDFTMPTRYSFISGCLLIVSITGCSTSPKSVNASVSMVPTTLTSITEYAKVIPQNSLPLGSTVIIDKVTYRVGRDYYSAMGLKCKSLLRDTQPSKQTVEQARAACKSNDNWFLFPKLVNSSK